MITRNICWFAVCVAAVAVVAGCNDYGISDAMPPMAIIRADRLMCQAGQDVTVTVRLTAPAGRKLDVYLPIRGRLHVQKKGGWFEMSPTDPDGRQVWVDLVPDERNLVERAFAIKASRVFPLTKESGWYEIWWEGSSDYCNMHSEKLEIRVFARAPAGTPDAAR